MLVGAYALLSRTGREQQEEFFALLAANPDVTGLEVPWSEGLSEFGADWLAAQLPEHWTVVVTSIPGTMAAIARDRAYGLASSDVAGAASALGATARLRNDVHRLNAARGARVVRAVELHSAPRRRESPSSADAFRASLEEVAGWDWDGAELLVEHVDAERSTHAPSKGFLGLDEEIAATAGLPVGIVINWARSAIELRDPDRAVEHIKAAAAAGVLRGLILSGVSAREWEDEHARFADSAIGLGDPASLLTRERAAAAIAAAGAVPYLGLKMGWRGAPDGAEPRATMIAQALGLIAEIS
jgi:hypothetical protein